MGGDRRRCLRRHARGRHVLRVITETNGIGETTKSSEQTQITVSAGNKPRVTFQTSKTGNTARNVYIGAVNGSSGGPYTLYASGITAATYDLTVAAPANSYAVAPPTINTTGLTYVDANGNTHNKVLELLRAAKDGNLEDAFRYLRTLWYEWNHGEPMTSMQIIEKTRHAHTVFAVLAQMCADAGTLIDANAGTLTQVATGIGGLRTKRTWP